MAIKKGSWVKTVRELHGYPLPYFFMEFDRPDTCTIPKGRVFKLRYVEDGIVCYDYGYEGEYSTVMPITEVMETSNPYFSYVWMILTLPSVAVASIAYFYLVSLNPSYAGDSPMNSQTLSFLQDPTIRTCFVSLVVVGVGAVITRIAFGTLKTGGGLVQSAIERRTIHKHEKAKNAAELQRIETENRAISDKATAECNRIADVGAAERNALREKNNDAMKMAREEHAVKLKTMQDGAQSSMVAAYIKTAFESVGNKSPQVTMKEMLPGESPSIKPGDRVKINDKYIGGVFAKGKELTIKTVNDTQVTFEEGDSCYLRSVDFVSRPEKTSPPLPSHDEWQPSKGDIVRIGDGTIHFRLRGTTQEIDGPRGGEWVMVGEEDKSFNSRRSFLKSNLILVKRAEDSATA